MRDAFTGVDRLESTRFVEPDGQRLYYGKVEPGLWRIVHFDPDRGPQAYAHVGPHYSTKVELLGDLERYATEYGFGHATVTDPLGHAMRALLAEHGPMLVLRAFETEATFCIAYQSRSEFEEELQRPLTDEEWAAVFDKARRYDEYIDGMDDVAYEFRVDCLVRAGLLAESDLYS